MVYTRWICSIVMVNEGLVGRWEKKGVKTYLGT